MAQLITAHNLFEEHLHFADKIGGLACPSMAVVRDDIPFTKYGPITLLADKEIVNPEREHVFDADIFSNRFPNIFYDCDADKLKEVLKAFEKGEKLSGESISPYVIVDELDRKGLKGFVDTVRSEPAAKIAFLMHKGITPHVSTKEPNLNREESKNKDIQNWYKKNNPSRLGWDNPKLLELGKMMEKEYEKQAETEAKKEALNLKEGEEYQDVYDDVFAFVYEGLMKSLSATPNGFMPTVSIICDIESDIRKLDKSELEFDIVAFEDAHHKTFSQCAVEYNSWLMELGSELPENPWLYLNDKKVPMTMDNIVKAMSSTVRDGEIGAYGLGQIRSVVAKQFHSFKEIENASVNLNTAETLENEKRVQDEGFGELVDSLRHYYRYQADRIGFRDEVISSIKDYLKKGPRELDEYYEDLDEEVIKDIDALVSLIANSSTEYFEAKIFRVIQLSEFKAAIVPDSLSEKAMDILKEAGLKIETYKPGNERSRLAAVNKIKDVKFGSVDKELKFESEDSLIL